jgi:hypothetical protein
MWSEPRSLTDCGDQSLCLVEGCGVLREADPEPSVHIFAGRVGWVDNAFCSEGREGGGGAVVWLESGC